MKLIANQVVKLCRVLPGTAVRLVKPDGSIDPSLRMVCYFRTPIRVPAGALREDMLYVVDLGEGELTSHLPDQLVVLAPTASIMEPGIPEKGDA